MDFDSWWQDVRGDEAEAAHDCPECSCPMTYVGPSWVCGECGLYASAGVDDDEGDDEAEGGDDGYGMTVHEDQDAPE